MLKLIKNKFFSFLAKDFMQEFLGELKTDPEIVSKILKDKLSLATLFDIKATDLSFGDSRNIIMADAFAVSVGGDEDEFGDNTNKLSEVKITMDKWLTVSPKFTNAVLADPKRKEEIASMMWDALVKGFNEKIINLAKTGASANVLTKTKIKHDLFVEAAKRLDAAEADYENRQCLLGSKTVYDLVKLPGFMSVKGKTKLNETHVGSYLGFECYKVQGIRDNEVYFASKRGIVGLKSKKFTGREEHVSGGEHGELSTNYRRLILQTPFGIKVSDEEKVLKAVID